MTRSLLLAAILSAAAATGATAHEKTAATTPQVGATVAEVPMLHVVFGGPMRVTFAELTRADVPVAITRKAGMEPVTELHATPDAALAPGAYRFEWRGLAEDGHPMQGELLFTVAE
ncbi:copper resistance protein CopC [uncultured Jannaschia sp.]|uniref:copper resistance CopC family protein n=1 Tax=Jannaschia halovivens TaxID=3388667 RepID=UPI0026138443|nr:copper resistance protein CopC [uncultured Jannaschia sp.]